MTNLDDFELIDEIDSSNEQVFELIDVNGVTEEDTNFNRPTTPNPVLPLLISEPLVEETPQVVEQQTPSPIVNTSELEEPPVPINTTITITPFVPIKQTIVQSPPIIFAPVPSLSKEPPLQRYGDAALIPHNLNVSLDINTIIDKSRQNQQKTLHVSAKQQQQQDIQTVLKQRRQLIIQQK